MLVCSIAMCCDVDFVWCTMSGDEMWNMWVQMVSAGGGGGGEVVQYSVVWCGAM